MGIKVGAAVQTLVRIADFDRREFLFGGAVVSTAGLMRATAASQNSADNPKSPASAGLNPSGVSQAGVRMIPVVNGRYKVWTKQVGQGSVKVLLLHGGPGIGHEYLEALEPFLPAAGFEIYYYDQLGVNFSDQPRDPTLWTLERYTEEVEEVRRGLGLDKFVLFGHSWGGILAIEYALRHSQRLRGLVISNMAASIDSCLRRTAALKKEMLTTAEQERLNSLEAAGAYDSPDYKAIVEGKLYGQMLCRLKPWPNAVDRALQHMSASIYKHMQGTSEFEVTGNLKGWDRWQSLKNISAPTLTIGSRYDEMDPDDMKEMARRFPKGRFAYCPNGSRMPFWDDQAVYFHELLAFLKTV